mmetsp:Transcript_16847/g.42283  ORF Transcript_16847/g.42283 Transcript_16847/m.42283 type:complete len:168 (-) Transcript_16847:193-696(-)
MGCGSSSSARKVVGQPIDALPVSNSDLEKKLENSTYSEAGEKLVGDRQESRASPRQNTAEPIEESPVEEVKPNECGASDSVHDLKPHAHVAKSPESAVTTAEDSFGGRHVNEMAGRGEKENTTEPTVGALEFQRNGKESVVNPPRRLHPVLADRPSHLSSVSLFDTQ